MPNILINPDSGILEFNTGSASGSAFDQSISGAARFQFQNSGELNLTSYGTGVADKFTIDGSNGRLFGVNNTVTGSIFSVNDVAGLPIVEVFSDDRVVMGQYATNALVVSGSGVSFGQLPTVSGNPVMTGDASYDTDTLQTVTDRGATTTNSISITSTSAGALAVDTDTLYVNASTDRVGINEDSVDATLHLTNVAGGVVNQKFERAGVSAWRLGIPTGQTYFAIDDSSDDLSTPEMVITTAGDVVIGTNANFPVVGTTPSGKLDIRGTSDGQLAFDIDGGSSDIKSAYNLELWADYDANNSAGYKNIYLKTNGDNTRMFISGDGKVGVGTIAPLALLDVAGGHAAGTAEWQDLAVGSAAAGWIDTNDGIGRIDFYGRSVGGLKVGASIAALADANWNGSVPWGRLEFKTANGATAATRMTLNSDG